MQAEFQNQASPTLLFEQILVNNYTYAMKSVILWKWIEHNSKC